MLRTYVDTNVYSELQEQTQPGDVASLRACLRSGGWVSAPISLADIEELLGELKTDRRAMVSKLSVARDLVGFHGMLKEPADILTEAIQAYADDCAAPSTVLAKDKRRVMVEALADIIAGSSRLDEAMRLVVADVDSAKNRWLSTMRPAQKSALAALERHGIKAETPGPPFEDF